MGAPVTMFEVHASDPQASIAFYQAALGWSFAERNLGGTVFWDIDTGGMAGRMIRRHGPAPEDGAPVMGATITAEVEDLDAAMGRAIAAGGSEALPRFEVPGVGGAAYVKDVDGNVLGLFEPSGEA